YQHGRQVPVVPDGSRDITAHVALDSLGGYRTDQRTALRGLGVDGSRPPMDQAQEDPPGYVAGLSRAGAAAELTDPDGLGGFCWLSTRPLFGDGA
nr:hypothetical protein [Actinomycetota bacterium]